MMRVTIEAELKELIRGIRLVVFDFDGVFTDNFVYVLRDGSEALRFWRGDGLGLQKLRKKKALGLLVLSSEKNRLVTLRCRKLKIQCIQGTQDKWKALEKVLRRKRLKPEKVAFVGNDINDLECLRRVGVPIVVRDAQEPMVRVARYRTKKKGGEGAVREVCDLFDEILDKGRSL